ncbi:MAG: hypothetical protein O7G85_06685 [Planctomycetota bacterium]|nr:hypothetical protein [Planctomycetota bacterium]
MSRQSGKLILFGSLLVGLIFATLVYGQSSGSGESTTTGWRHHLEYQNVRSIAFDPNGNSVYVHLHEPVINVWAVLVNHWPELLTGVLVLETLLLIAFFIRIGRRPQLRDRPYCRRCNYDLSSHVECIDDGKRGRFDVTKDTKCSECGIDLNCELLRRGKSARRRLALIGPVWLVTSLGLVAMFGLGVPRQGAVSRHAFWPSTGLVEIVEARKIGFLGPWIKNADHVIEVDLERGLTIRTVLMRQSLVYSDISISRDGQWLFLSGPKPNEMTRYGISDGQVKSSVMLPGMTMGFHDEPSIIAFAPDDSMAYVQWLDYEHDTCGVSAWDLENDQCEVMVKTPAYLVATGSRNAPISRSFLVDTSRDTPQFFSKPHFLEAYRTDTFIVQRHEFGNDDCLEYQPLPNPDSRSTAVLTPDGRFLVVAANRGTKLLLIDVLNQETHEFSPFRSIGRVSMENFSMSEDGTLLVGGFHKYVHLIDFHAQKTIKSLPLPPGLAAPHFWISPDNRWLGAVCLKTGRNMKGGFDHELVLWDLQSILPAKGESSLDNDVDRSLDSDAPAGAGTDSTEHD